MLSHSAISLFAGLHGSWSSVLRSDRFQSLCNWPSGCSTGPLRPEATQKRCVMSAPLCREHKLRAAAWQPATERKPPALKTRKGPLQRSTEMYAKTISGIRKGKWYKKICEERRKRARQDWELHSGKGWPRAAGYAFSRKRFFGAERSRHCAASRPMRWTAMTERATVRRVRRPVSPEVGGSMWR